MLQSRATQFNQSHETGSYSDQSLRGTGSRGALNLFPKQFCMQIVRVSTYLLISILIFSVFYRSASIRLLEEKYFNSDDMLYNKTIRGMFPDFEGHESDLRGKWDLTYISEPNSEYQFLYTISFHDKGKLRIMKKGCKGNVAFKWVAYYHNVKIWEWVEEEGDMNIQPDDEDLLCIKETNTRFFQLIKKACIWTISDKTLYLIIQDSPEAHTRMTALGFTKK